jgi:NAD(P)H-hydrate repair Nnr-like enzyme with NAD(P)H-hydrate dehydratase domain
VLDADALNALALLDPSEWPKRRDWSNVVLTPHMGEFMRLMNAVMKRGGTIAQAAADPQSLSTPPSPGSPKRGRSLADDDDTPSTADGVVLEIAPEESGSGETPATPATPAGSAPSEPSHTSLAELLARSTGAVVLLKGHRTVITDGHRFAVNTTGNPAMATAGSGDVLTGVIASLIGQKFSAIDAAVLGAHLHGMAGDLAAAAIGPAGIVATDIISHLPQALARRGKGA